MKTPTISTLLAALTACSGGQPCFSPSSLITSPRIVAIKTEPPMAYVDPTGQTPIAPIDISALVVQEATQEYGEYGYAVQVKSGTAVTFKVCLTPTVSQVDPSPACPDGTPAIGTLATIPDVNTPFTYTPPLPLIQAALAQDPVGGLGGIQLRLEMDVDVSGLTAAHLVGTKTLSFLLQGSPATLNHGLVLTGMEVSDGGDHQSFQPGYSVPLTVAQTTGLRPLVGPGAGADAAAETYLAYDNSGTLTRFTEHITYAFYAGNALFFGQTGAGGAAIYNGAAGDEADEPAPGTPDPPDGLVSVEPVYPGNQGEAFWVVARDDRGAVTWANVPYNAKELRSNCGTAGANSSTKCPVALYGCN